MNGLYSSKKPIFHKLSTSNFDVLPTEDRTVQRILKGWQKKMSVKCKVLKCRSFTTSANGLCNYHERKAIEFEEARDYEQRPTEERQRLELRAAQTFEKFSAAGETRRKEEEANYEKSWRIIRVIVETTRKQEILRETWNQLKEAQEELKSTQPLDRDQRNELWKLLQEGFANEKKKREAKQREWEERKRRGQENAAALKSQVRAAEQEAQTSTDWREARERLKAVQQEIRQTQLAREDRQEFFDRMNRAFETLSRRQTEAQQQYERECSENHRYAQGKVDRACEHANHGSDFRAAFDALRNAQQSLRETRPLKREDRNELFASLQSGFETMKRRREEYQREQQREFEERKRERERKHQEWRERQLERISNLEGAISRLRNL